MTCTRLSIILLLIVLAAALALAQTEEKVGKRPYELDWAGRTQDDHPPLVNFEDLTGWWVQGQASEATFVRTREQQIWDKYVGKLTYRYTGQGQPEVRFGPPNPIPITGAFDAVTCWIYGNNWGYARDVSTPPVNVSAQFRVADGQDFTVPLIYVNWVEWHLAHERLTPAQLDLIKGGNVSFVGFLIRGGRNTADRVLYFDNLAVYKEDFKSLTFAPRRARGVAMFPGQTVGTNTGPGKLPFPTRPETILPANLAKDAKVTLRQQGKSWVFSYAASDGRMTWTVTPATGTGDDVTVQWAGRGGAIKPCAGGGVYLLDTDGKAAPPEKRELLSAKREGDLLVTRWRVTLGKTQSEVTYRYQVWGKTLVWDTFAPGGVVAEVRYGQALGLEDPRLVTNPYYHYGPNRPAVAVSGPVDKPLFLTGNTDWYRSNASQPFAVNEIKEGRVSYQGGTRYIPKTDGKRNDCYERFFVTLSPQYEEVLPTVANPQSPYMQVTGTHLWRAHGASDRERDKQYWADVHRYGCTQVVITDHETGWRDGGESFTFRTRPAPGKGGDQGQYDYARFMQDKLGFVYGPYNNFTDFAPVNEYWSTDLISRTSDNQLQSAWMRCYAPKPARAVEYCEKLSPINESKFHFSTAYCDVHTAVAPWDRVDYDARVPGAGTFAATFYAYGEIMLLQKQAWDGPVYSEGNHHFYYSGLTDGNYAQDRAYDLPNQPWLVDLDLRKMHPLGCNFGMGAPSMFYGEGQPRRQPKDTEAYTDRFLAATVAFGHPGFLVGGPGQGTLLRGYYMLQQLHSRYCLTTAQDIRYVAADGKLYDTSAAVARGVYQRSQVATRYADGTVTVVNGNLTERLATTAFGHKVDLPPNGYAGWTADGKIEVFSGDRDGRRCDYSVSPEYIYVDGRGRFTRFAQAASNGPAVCRFLPGGQYEIIPLKDTECGFAVQAKSAVALDKAGKELGPATLRVSRGLTYVEPVKDAFSYRLEAGRTAAPAVSCARDELIPGERCVVKCRQEHAYQAPADAKTGQRLWQQFEGAWLDFTVVSLAEARCSLRGNDLVMALTSNLPDKQTITATLGDQQRRLALAPRATGEVAFDLGAPVEETAEVLTITLAAGELRQDVRQGVQVSEGLVKLAETPEKFTAGMCLRGKPESADMGTTAAHVVRGERASGNVSKDSIAMHPPWQGGVGYAFALLDPVTLPATPPAAFRAVVGKGDGSDLGDGILYKLAVVDAKGAETLLSTVLVTEHKWTPIEGDLTRWAGQTVRLKLISDVGENDDSSGDWACWADLRFESLKPQLTRILVEDSGRMATAPAPFPVRGLKSADLRAARSATLHYDGCGLSGTGDYGSFAAINGVKIGNLAPAGGNEAGGVWAEEVSIPLTPEAIAALKVSNTFELLNPNRDYFKVRRFWLEVELADGRKASTTIATAAYTQPPEWPYAEGYGVPFGQNITANLVFPR